MKRTLNILIWTLSTLGLLFLLGFIDRKNDMQLCRGIVIDVDCPQGIAFHDRKSIRHLIGDYGYQDDRQAVCEVDAGHLEQFLRNDPFVKNADVYRTIDGYIHIKVKQRIPIIRIFNADGESYYIDEDGWLMPVSATFSADVPVATGNLHEPWALRYHTNMDPLKSLNSKEADKTILNDLYTLAKHIRRDAFLDAQLTQVFVDENANIVLIPRVGDHKIVLGNVQRLDEKMNKLKVFYLKGLSNVGWNAYSTINLKYKDQVVCTKK